MAKKDELFVDGPIPEELVPGLSRPFTESESIIIRHKVNLSSADDNLEKPKCLWIVGPSAVGKSTITAVKSAELFEDEDNAVVVDGALLRECHGGWKAVVDDGFNREEPRIHKEAWNILKASKVINKRKGEIQEEAMKRRMHIIVPDTCSDVEKTLKKIKGLEAAGYEQHLICLWAPRKDTLKRGTSRQCKEGKTFSLRGYTDSMQGSYKLAQYFRDKFDITKLNIMTTDKFPNMMLSIEELGELAKEAEKMLSPEEEQASQMRRRLKHAGKRAGIASRFIQGECQAATKIQAVFRGGKCRRTVSEKTGFSSPRKPGSERGAPAASVPEPSKVSDAQAVPSGSPQVSPQRIVRVPETGARQRINLRLVSMQDDLFKARKAIAEDTRATDSECLQLVGSIQRAAEDLCNVLRLLDQQTAQRQHKDPTSSTWPN